MLVGLAVAINIVIAGTGNMHSGKHHPTWVETLSWIFTADLLALLAIGIASWRSGRAPAGRGV